MSHYYPHIDSNVKPPVYERIITGDHKYYRIPKDKLASYLRKLSDINHRLFPGFSDEGLHALSWFGQALWENRIEKLVMQGGNHPLIYIVNEEWPSTRPPWYISDVLDESELKSRVIISYEHDLRNYIKKHEKIQIYSRSSSRI